MEEHSLRVCKKCLLGAHSKEEFFQKLEAYIANLDPETTVDQKTYEKRLEICGACENITEGMCRLCGCFVELRAALKVRKCPAIERKW